MGASEERAIVITGSRGNVGSAIVNKLLGSAPLALVDHTQSNEPLPGGGRVARFIADLGDEASTEATARAIRDQLGPVRALVHTVGGYSGGVEVAAQALSSVRKMLEINYLAAVNITKALLPDILASEHGRIVFFASGDALRARAGGSAYAASKAALLRFAEALAEEVAPRGVGVRVIAPTTIDTPLNRKAMPDAKFEDWVGLSEIAETVAFLVAPGSSGVRFATLPLGR